MVYQEKVDFLSSILLIVQKLQFTYFHRNIHKAGYKVKENHVPIEKIKDNTVEKLPTRNAT